MTRSLLRLQPRLLPWLLPYVVTVLALISLDVPVGPIAKYTVYFALAVALPGILILRALWRSTGNWAEDFGLGSAVGATYQLVGWAIFTALGWQRALVVWPALVLIAFAAVPRLRKHWRILEPKPLPLLWTWGMVIASAILLGGTVLGTMKYHPAPPDGTSYYQDLLYHLSMLNELTRSVPPELPQVSGEALEYHWFANADMAAAVDITGLSPIVVLFRLWLLPQLLVALLVCATLARTVSRAWWTGVLAAAALAGPQLFLFIDTAVNLSPPLSLLSPSQTFGMIAGTTAAVFLIHLLFEGEVGKGLWLLAFTVAVVGGGAKPTTLPILVGAVGLAALFLLIRDRRLPWRFITAGSLLVAAAVGTMVTVAGSTSGSGLQLLAVVKTQGGYAAATGDKTLAGEGGPILPALTSGQLLSIGGVVVVTALLLLGQLLAVVGYGLLGKRELRRDPVGWFLLGALIAGWAGFLVVDHPSISEAYFVHSAVPFSLAAVGWLAAVMVSSYPQENRRRVLLGLSAVAVVLGALFAFILLTTDAVPVGSQLRRIALVARPLLVVAAVTAVLTVGWFLLRKRVRRLAGLGGLLVLLTLLVVPSARIFEQNLHLNGGKQAQTFTSATWWVYPDEEAAALWLAKNSEPTDVVVSNTWCRPAPKQGPGCDARGYLVSGIAGRRTFLEGWGYTSQAMVNHGVGGLRYNQQPSPWPERVELTNQAIYRPTPEVLRLLRERYQVRWVYADSFGGPVSPELEKLAVLRHSWQRVRIYELTG
ncbi:hypothetical protein [Kribbella sp. CA-293567]|uniref:hypothetical protein n=1 Tax=Kribbella sp. CA-293567 TaxID=3002436 RepID=UPI0022DDE7A7|nr:hypothetical protein [Kribbella sp. CA-293567]WBQ07313.1 hypothetical protein OX958_11015 [Kribbella sp. CA-293567]